MRWYATVCDGMRWYAMVCDGMVCDGTGCLVGAHGWLVDHEDRLLRVELRAQPHSGYAMLCCAVLCCAVLCYAMRCDAMLCYACAHSHAHDATSATNMRGCRMTCTRWRLRTRVLERPPEVSLIFSTPSRSLVYISSIECEVEAPRRPHSQEHVT